MKLLDWMHRKFRQQGNDSFKDFSIGNPCTCLIGQPSLDGQQYSLKQSCGIRSLQQAEKELTGKSFSGLGEVPEREDYYIKNSPAALSDQFDGFLSIGTLGSDPAVPDPPTTTFPVSDEKINEKGTEVIENELKLINDELEKFLGAEAKEDSCSFSSGRNSLVSIGRSSHGSTITLSGKPIEASDNEAALFPLQGYLFGSAVDLSETSEVKKINRTSLGELFQRTKFPEESSEDMPEKEEKRASKDGEKSAVHHMKKMLKKKMLNISQKNSNRAVVGMPDSSLTESKLQKILHLFHRKVHPENSTATKKHPEPPKNENYYVNGRPNNEDQNHTPPGEDNMTYSHRGSMRCSRSQCNASSVDVKGINSNGNREYWIKTDADYLVLEL